MKVSYTPHFRQKLRKFPREIQGKFKKQVNFLLSDISHPSLQVKKYDKKRGVWQARVDISVRFYFLIGKDTYTLLNIKHHPK